MMKFALLFALLFVSTLANPFPFLGGYNSPNNLDTPDDDQERVNVAGQAGAAQAGAGQQQQNDQNDSLEDQAAAAGQAGQTGTTMAPEVDSSDSSSSSSEEDGTDAPDLPDGTGTTAIPANPQAGAGGTGGQQNAGDSSGNADTVNAVGGPVVQPQAAPGDSSGENLVDPAPNALNMPQALKERQAKRSGAATALTTLLLVAGVASISAVAYKYKDAIRGRLGF